MHVDWIVRHHKVAVASMAAATVVSILSLGLRGLRRDYSLEAFVATQSDAYALFRRVMDEFVSTELAVIAIESGDAQSQETLALAEHMVRSIRPMRAVQRATSLADVLASLPEVVRGYVASSVREHPLFAGNLISYDGRTAAIVLQMAGEGATGAERVETVGRLREIVADARLMHPEWRIVLAGPYVTLIDMYDYVDRDLLTFSVSAAVLSLVMLGVVFRRWAAVLFATAVAGSATICTLGLASLLNLPATLITQMIVILVVVLSVANGVHLIAADDEIFGQTPFLDWRERARRVLGRMLAPCSAVMITTAVGFGSVAISSITPVRMFGFLMVVGLVLSLVFSMFATVVLIRIRPATSSSRKDDRVSNALRELGRWVVGRRTRIMVGFAVGVALFDAGLPRLEFESDFVKNFRPNSDVRKSYEFIETHLTPTGSIEVVVRRRGGGSILSADSVAGLHRLGHAVVSRMGAVGKALSLADALTLSPGGLPTTAIGLAGRLALSRRLLGDDAIRNFLNADETALRLNLRAREGISVHQKLAMAARIEQLAAEEMGPEFEVEVTGLYVFYAGLVADLWRDQFRSLSLTVPLVLAVLIVVLRSVGAGVVAMVPTVLPVVFCLGAMGWLGIPINMTTAMMLSVTVGIAVDDAVHYLWRLRATLKDKGDYGLAIGQVHGSVGRACVFTTVVIAGGFWILMISEFLPTAYFGGLLGFTMCCALAGDLLLLPAMVLAFQPFGKARLSGFRPAPE